MPNTFTSAMDITKPAGTRSLLLGDDDIREFKVQYCERFDIDHMQPQAEGGVDTVGFHRKVTLIKQASDPLAVSDALIAYAKLSGSYSELFVNHENAGVIQLTRLGKLWIESLGIASEANGDILCRVGGVWTRVGIGTALQQLRVNAAATSVEYFTPASTFTSKMIMMFSGLQADIPSGWVICDGTNSTPDLRDKFVIGAKQESGGTWKSNIEGALYASIQDANGLLQPPKTSEGVDASTGGAAGGADAVKTAHKHTFVPPYYALAFIMKS